MLKADNKPCEFITGGPVRHESPYYISRNIERTIIQKIQKNNYVSIIGSRQMGKTSILLYVRDLFQSYGKTCVFMDLSAFNNQDATWDSWITHFCNKLIQEIPDHEILDINIPLPASSPEFMNYCVSLIKQINSNGILFLLDEASAIPSRVKEDFYGILRVIYNERAGASQDNSLHNLNFVFAGVFDTNKLVSNENSPFNVSQIKKLSDFSLDEVYNLGKNLECCGFSEVEALAETIYSYTSGHPYLTQCFYSIVADKIMEGHFDKTLMHQYVHNLSEEASININHVVRSSLQPRYRNIIKSLLNGNNIPYSNAREDISQLELFGAINEKDGFCKIRNQIYKTSFLNSINELTDNDNNPDPENYEYSKINGLKLRHERLLQDIDAASKQLSYTLGQVERLKINRQIMDLEKEVVQIETKLNRL